MLNFFIFLLFPFPPFPGLTRWPWLIFNCAVDVVSKTSVPYTRSQEFTLTFSKSFIVFSFTFRSVIPFQLIFVYGVRQGPKLIYLYMNIQLPHHHLLRSLFMVGNWFMTVIPALWEAKAGVLLESRKWAYTRHQICQCLDLGLSSLWNYEK